jgi:DNA-binding HxlR family transcriptional regulator
MSKPAAKRQFSDACGLAHALELVGERWALLILRELLLGPRRFSDLRGDLPGLSANVLTQRLGELEGRHLIRRLTLPPPAKIQVYALTDWGQELEPAILALARWAYRSPGHDRMLPLGRVPMLLSLKANLRAEFPPGLALDLGFRLDGAPYWGRIDMAGLAIGDGEPVGADLRYEGTPRGLAARIYGRAPLADLKAAGALSCIGDPELERCFASLFLLPPRYDPDEKGSTPPL